MKPPKEGEGRKEERTKGQKDGEREGMKKEKEERTQEGQGGMKEGQQKGRMESSCVNILFGLVVNGVLRCPPPPYPQVA
jgi:hypothetical protein